MTDERAIALLESAVKTPSLSGQEHAVATLLATEMSRQGARARIDDAGNAVGSFGSTDPAAREIVLLGHTDVVAGEVPVRREGDLLYGRGTVDAKGPLVAFIAAASDLPLPPGVRLTVIGAVEEEIATSKGARTVIPRHKPAACIIGEPSGWDSLTLGYKGRMLVTGRVRRTLTHTAAPTGSAADALIAWWQTVLTGVAELNKPRQGAFGTVSSLIRSFHAGNDGLLDTAEVIASFRLPPGVVPADMRRLCEAHAGETVLEFTGEEVAYVGDRNSPVARHLSTSIRDQGARPHIKHKTGTCDLNVVGPAWKCPIAAYGPGDSLLDHTPHEHISLPEFLASVRVLRQALQGLAGELGPKSPERERAGLPSGHDHVQSQP